MSEQTENITSTPNQTQTIQVNLNNDIPVEQSIYEKEVPELEDIDENELSNSELVERLMQQVENQQQIVDQQLLQQQQLPQINEYQLLSELPRSKRDLIRKIRNYGKLFDKQIIILKPLLDIDKLKLFSEPQLNELFEELKLEVRSNRNVTFVSKFIRSGVQIYESILNIFTNANGLSDEILKDEELLLDIKELIFEYDQSFTSLDPKKRILLTLIKYTYSTIQKNKSLELKQIQEKKIYVDNSDIEKYKHL